MSFDLTGKVALVTGAGRGLGREIALGLARAGALVLAHGRRVEALEPVVEAIEAEGGRAVPLPFDLGDEAALETALNWARSHFGPVTVLVNNAGARDRRPLPELDRVAVRALLEIDLVAPFDLCRRVAGHMPEGGRIVNVTSIAGPIARAGDAAYTAAKGGLDALTRALSAELGPRGITVNAVAPGYFATEANRAMVEDKEIAAFLAKRTSLGRWGEPSEIAGAVVFLASPAASYVSGQTLAVDGGYLSHF
ncbi:MAG: SDR family oxidoreductase [Zavarzinia sp.]|nr:SDR family oxidoreductase [Zavarzinia sp.]